MAKATLVARATFATEVDGQERIVYAGTVVSADDPLAKGREGFFEPETSLPTRRLGRSKD